MPNRHKFSRKSSKSLFTAPLQRRASPEFSRSLNKINKIFHTPLWLFILLIIVLILRIPSFFEAYSYGDEMIYLALGNAIRKGIPLYSAIHDNKPPFLYLIAALSGSLFWFKSILAMWNLITIYVFWKFIEKLFDGNKSKFSVIIATCIFALLTTLPFFEGNIANAELFMLLPTISAFYLLLPNTANLKKIFAAGILFSLASLFKMPAMFDVGAIVFFWLIINLKFKSFKSYKEFFIKSLVLGAGFLIPIAISFVWYYLQGALREYFIAAYLQNVGYLSSWRPSDVQKPFLVRNLPLLIRFGVLLASSVLLYFKKEKLSKTFIFTVLWLLFSLFAVTLSERPYPHYFIQTLPALTILLTIFLTSKTMEQIYSVFPIFLFFLVSIYFSFWHYYTVPYYKNFAKLALRQTSKEEYLRFFGGKIPTIYKVSEFVTASTYPDEKIFVWGDNSSIYALSRRLPPIKYVADYHIKDFSSEADLVDKLNAKPPKLLIFLPDANIPASLIYFARNNYLLVNQIDQAQIWVATNDKPRN